MASGDWYEDLLVAVLATNNKSIDWVFQFLPGLREQGLLNPVAVAGWELESVSKALIRAGYDRKGETLNQIFASRVLDLSMYVRDFGFEKLGQVVKQSSWNEVENLLLKFPGIGPAVVRNFGILRGKTAV